MVAELHAAMRAAIADDLNVPLALGKLFELVKEVNKLEGYDRGFASEVLAVLSDVDEVLAVLEPEPDAGLSGEEQQLFEGWVAARAAKDWAQADALRAQLQERGIGVQARKGESTWTRL